MLAMPQIETAPRGKIRWAIGSADGPRSSTWRLWGGKKGDFYVAVRSLGATTKASFHRDGKCQVGFTQEYAGQASQRFGVKSRHWETWKLPPAPTVRVLQVLVPRADLRRFSERKSGDVQWVPLPPEGFIGVTSVFLTETGTGLGLPEKQGPLVVGRLKTSTRDAWVVYSCNPIDPELALVINAERSRFKVMNGGKKLPEGTRATLWDSREDHDRHVLELACD